MADTYENAQQDDDKSARKALARAMWLASDSTPSDPEARKAEWSSSRSEATKQARKVLAKLEKSGYTVVRTQAED